MSAKTLSQVVLANPFPDFADWWAMGPEFIGFMSSAIHAEWAALPGSGSSLEDVETNTTEYLSTVYGHSSRSGLVRSFVERPFEFPIQSGEFDALSYAFFKSAYDILTANIDTYAHSLVRERRLFTKRVGKHFYQQVHQHLGLDLPTSLETMADFHRLQNCLSQLGVFLQKQGYLRDHFAFNFAVETRHAGQVISQSEADFIPNLNTKGIGYALYEMGYPAILPSAVYLYQLVGEAQHHSSRTMEELFERIGYVAYETEDFDPTGHPSDLVVELWEIRKLDH